MGQAVAISNREHSASELRRIASRHKDAEMVRRLLALAQVLDGQSRTEAARQNGMDRQTLCDWVHRYNAAGVAGLASRVPAGPTPRLDETQRAELEALVLTAPIPRRTGWCAGAVLICASR
jgi:transposase